MNLFFFMLIIGCWENSENREISMPLLNNLGGTLKADIDVTQMNAYLSDYIQQEVTKGVKIAMKDVLGGIARNITTQISEDVEQRFTELSNKQPPAFFASLKPGLTPGLNEVIKFDSVKTNIGGGYSSSTGIFTTPQAGLYMISSTMRSVGGKHLHCEIRINNVQYAKMFGRDWGQGTANIVVQLQTGDKVTVVKNNSYNEGVSPDLWSFFSGFLIA